MGKRKYSSGVSHEYHELLMDSSEAREERRRAALERIPAGIGMIIRGRSRDIEPRNLSGPYAMDRNWIVASGRRLDMRGSVAKTQFTQNIPVLPDSRSYQNYVSAGNRHNRRHETDPQEREQARLARLRQTQHVADRLHKEVWSEWQLAQLFGVATRNIKESVKLGANLDDTAVNIAASAIEDYGYSLIESEEYKLLHYGKRMAENIIHIGQYAVERPESLRAQPSELYLLVQREQERREQHWEGLLDLYEQPVDAGWGGVRRSAKDLQDEQENLELVTRLSASISSVE